MEYAGLQLLTSVATCIASMSAAGSLAINVANKNGLQLDHDFKGDLDLLASIQDYGSKIRHAIDPHDATERRRDLVEYIEHVCMRYNDGSFSDSMRSSVEALLSTALVRIRKSWTNEDGRKIFAEKSKAYPEIQQFCNTNIDRIGRIWEEMDASQLNMFKWRAPVSRIPLVTPNDAISYPAAA